MVTRAEGAVMRMTYEKYRSRRKVEPGDLDMLDRLAEAARIRFSYETDGIYAQAVRLRGYRTGCGVTVPPTISEGPRQGRCGINIFSVENGSSMRMETRFQHHSPSQSS